jgi:hypothetical protein
MNETDVLLSALEQQLNVLRQDGVAANEMQALLLNVCTIAKMIEPLASGGNQSGTVTSSDSGSEVINVQPPREAVSIMNRAANAHCRAEMKLESALSRAGLQTFGGSKSTFVEVPVIHMTDVRVCNGKTKKDGWCRVLLPVSYMVAFIKQAEGGALLEKGHVKSWFEKHEEAFIIVAGRKQTPKWKSSDWVEMNGFEIAPNIHEEAHIIQLRGLSKSTDAHGYLEALTDFVTTEKTRQFLEGELKGLPPWCKPWAVTDAIAAPVIGWCREVRSG